MEFENISSNQQQQKCTQVNIMSYNILADCYVRVQDQPWNAFSYCEDEAIEWLKRCAKIQTKLVDSKADIICLQEMTWEMVDGLWVLPAWTECLTGSSEYIGVMQALPQKDITKNAERNLRSCGRRTPTGVATFYRRSMFTEFSPATHGSGSGTTVFLRTVSTIDAAAVHFIVNNVHLVGSPSKLAEQSTQLGGVMKQLTKGFNVLGSAGDKGALTRTAFVVCGDFNSDVQLNSMQPEVVGADGDSLTAAASLSAPSVVFGEQGFSRAPTGTSYYNNTMNCRLDHIMFRAADTQSGIEVQAGNCTPLCGKETKPTDTITDESSSSSSSEHAQGLPSMTEPSDHLSVRTTLTVTP